MNPVRNIQEKYQKAILFAAEKHGARGQMVPGTKLPYLLHLSNVAMEIFTAAKHLKRLDIGFMVQVALLHDTIEDTKTTKGRLERKFGKPIAEAVAALTKSKRKDRPKKQKMLDSLERIKLQPKEVWCVKIADRITNLQPPPKHWTMEKKINYREEAKLILKSLRGANAFLEQRLKRKIAEYGTYCKK